MRTTPRTVLALSLALMPGMVSVACAQANDSDAPAASDAAAASVAAEEAPAGAVHEAVPDHPDPDATYLFYLHGAIIESQGRRPTHPEYGVYEYDQILDALAARGFQVISEARPAGTQVPAYAEKVADQVRSLVEAGVPADHIAVAGHSKGAMITLGVSSLLDPDRYAGVRYVVMAGCFRGGSPIRGLRLSGHLLSIYDDADRLAGSCDTVFTHAAGAEGAKEIVLHTGLGHGAFYSPRDVWLGPLTAWLTPSRAR